MFSYFIFIYIYIYIYYFSAHPLYFYIIFPIIYIYIFRCGQRLEILFFILRSAAVISVHSQPRHSQQRQQLISYLFLKFQLRRWADLFLIAPLDANTMAKLSHGICDNLIVRKGCVKALCQSIFLQALPYFTLILNVCRLLFVEPGTSLNRSSTVQL